MVEKTVIVTNETGLHARPASDFVKEATKCECEVSLRKGDRTINAKSILGVLSLGINKGSEVTIVTSGADETEALDRLVALVENLKD